MLPKEYVLLCQFKILKTTLQGVSILHLANGQILTDMTYLAVPRFQMSWRSMRKAKRAQKLIRNLVYKDELLLSLSDISYFLTKQARRNKPCPL